MTTHVTLAGVQEFVAAKLERDHISGSEVQEFAAARGIAPRTLRRYAREGLVSAPQRVGQGRGRGAEFPYPSRGIFEIALVAEARKATHSLQGIRHWLWWIGYPIEWERWHADRIEELAGRALAELPMSEMTRTQRDREAAKLADELGKRRPFPLRGQALRTESRRHEVAQWILDGRYAGVAPDPTEALGEGRDTTVGGALDRAFMRGLRAEGWLGPAPVGAQIAELLVTVPNFGESFRRLEALTEAKARELWRVAAGLEAAGLVRALGYPRLRDAPAYAALWLVYLQWGLPAALVGELAALAA